MSDSARIAKTADLVVQGTFPLRGALHRLPPPVPPWPRREPPAGPRGATGPAPLMPAPLVPAPLVPAPLGPAPRVPAGRTRSPAGATA
jgi:hypothetical protein